MIEKVANYILETYASFLSMAFNHFLKLFTKIIIW